MSSFISAVYSKFPQNGHAAEASKIESKIQTLTTASTDTSSTVFKDKVTDIKDKLSQEKETCIDSIRSLNGGFFQDPESILKKTWDAAVSDVKNALNENLETRDQLDGISEQLKSKSQNNVALRASTSISNYKYYEEERDAAELRLNEILSVEKTYSEVLLSLDGLEKRQKELCGEYYQDPNGLLDLAWKKYQDSCNSNDLETYNTLETERKNNEILIKMLNFIGPALPGRTIEQLAKESIQGEIGQLEQDKKSEEASAGIDWRKTAIIGAASLVFGLANGSR